MTTKHHHPVHRSIPGAVVAALAALGAISMSACSDSATASGGSFCDALEQTSQATSELAGDVDDAGDVADLFEHLADIAPDEISDDVQVVSDAMVRLATVPTDDPNAVSDAVDIVLSPEVTSATERIGRYAVDQCGITPEAWQE